MTGITVDTNILVYSVDDRDPTKHAASIAILTALEEQNGRLGVQTCGEFYSAATRRLKRPVWGSAQAARNFATAFDVFSPSYASLVAALGEAASGRFSFRDANLLAAAEAAGCTHIISEDMADGARLGRIEVVGAFGPDGVSDRARALLKIDEA